MVTRTYQFINNLEGGKIYISYSDADKIDSGSFGVVYKGIVTETNQAIAVKVIDKFSCRQKCKYEAYFIEADIMRELTKPHIQNTMPLFGYLDLTSNYIIAMPFAVNGTLDDWLNNKDKSLTPLQQIETIKGICQGLAEMHKRKIIHRDLKPRNILFDENMVPKVSDFGLSNSLSDLGYEICGTLHFLAPELLYSWYILGKGRQHTIYSDLYALAIVAWCIVANEKKPYLKIITKDDYTLQEKKELGKAVYEEQYREEIPAETNENIRCFIESLWAHVPEKRLQTKAALQLLNAENQEVEQYVTFEPTNMKRNSSVPDGHRHFESSSDFQNNNANQIRFCNII